MEVGGIKTKWLFADDLEGRKITGEFTGVNKVKTKTGEMEVAIFVSSEGVEYQISSWSIESEKKFEVNTQRAELSKDGKNIRVKLL